MTFEDTKRYLLHSQMYALLMCLNFIALYFFLVLFAWMAAFGGIKRLCLKKT